MSNSRAAALLVIALAVPDAHAGTANGFIVIGDKKIDVKHAYATTKPEKKGKDSLRVIVSDIPLDDETVRSEMKLMRLAFDSKITCLDFTLEPANASISWMLRSSQTTGSISASQSPSIAKPSKWTDARFEGEFVKAETSKVGDTEYAFSFTVEADILKPVVVVPPTAADTAAALKSEQARVYLAYLQAMRGGNKVLIRQFVVAEKAKMMDTPDFAKMLGLIQRMMPAQIRVRRLTETGDTSVLSLSGLQGGQSIQGKVEMVKEGGKWKVSQESWGDNI